MQFNKYTYIHTYIHTHIHTYIVVDAVRETGDGNGRDTGGKRKKSRKKWVGLVAANPDNLESNKEAGG